MRKINFLLFAFVLATISLAADRIISVKDLPPDIILLLEPSGQSGRFNEFQLQLVGGEGRVVFSASSNADTFLSTLPDNLRERFSTRTLPRGFIEQAAQNSKQPIYVDPKSPTELVGHLGAATSAVEVDNPELKEIQDADQSDRRNLDNSPEGRAELRGRDARRKARVREFYELGKLITGQDYYRAALVLQHGDVSADFLLAHNLAVTAVFRGINEGRWLAAATLDRFLISINRDQYFGTQYKVVNDEGNIVLRDVDGDATDRLRAEFNVPSLDAARNRKP